MEIDDKSMDLLRKAFPLCGVDGMEGGMGWMGE